MPGYRYATWMTALGLAGCAVASAVAGAAASGSPHSANPFLSPSSLPYQLPDFRAIRDSDFAPALEAGMAQQRREIAAIANNPQAPTFENTIVAQERAGAILNRVLQVLGDYNSAIGNPQIDTIEEQYSPKLAAHQDAINFNPKLFARIRRLYQERAQLHLDSESLQLLERYYRNFVHAGAALSGEKRRRLRELDEQLAVAGTRFQEAALKANNDGAVIVDHVEELDGLSPSDISGAAAAAQARGLTGRWLIALEHTTAQPILANLKNRDLRERIYRASIARGNGGPDDTTAIISQLVRLRAERAALFGYPNFAAYQIDEQEAKTPAAVRALLGQIAPFAVAAARHDGADAQALIDSQALAAGTPTFELQPWDWQFYTAQVGRTRLGFSDEQVRPYFELDRVVQDGLFYAVSELYGISFTRRSDLYGYDPSVRVYEVRDADGAPLGLFLADYFARDNKQGGAWEDAYVSESKLLGHQAVVVNCLNIPRPEPGQPVLLTFDQVEGMFHEMGHALHDLLSTARYPLLTGTNVPEDFAEFPSQFNEMWARDPKVLAHMARHYQTGELMPSELRDKVIAAQRLDQGYATLSNLESALLDLSWHEISAAQAPPADQVMEFEARALAANGLDYGAVPPRYHSPYFLHIFSASTGYDAAYYSYLWSQVLARDAGQWFTDHGGLTRANGEVFRSKILARGRTQEPEVLWQAFYGRAPEIGPLLDYKGFPRS